MLKDANEKEEELLKQIDEREEKIRVLEDTSTSIFDDKAFLQTILSMNQPKITLEDKTVKNNVDNSSENGQSRPSDPTPPKMRTFIGKEDGRPYFLQFCHIVNNYNWSDKDRLDKLIECLIDRALNFFLQQNQSLYKIIIAAARGKVYQLLANGRWFSPGTPASSTTKTGHHDITEILLKVVLNTKNIK